MPAPGNGQRPTRVFPWCRQGRLDKRSAETDAEPGRVRHQLP